MFAKYSKILASLIYVEILLSVFSCDNSDSPLSNIDDSLPPCDTLNNNKIWGRVFTTDVYPTFFISNAAITLKGDTSQFQTFTSDSGKYIINDIASGNFLIEITSSDYDTVKKNITLTGTDTIEIDFDLPIKYDFQPGIVLMGIADSASFRSVFYFADSIGFTLRQMNGFKHTINLLPLDSANGICNFLFEKPYLNKHGFQPKLIEIGDSAEVTVSKFFDMSREEFIDWFSVRDSLGIFYVNILNKDIQIHVPVGEEKYWLNEFKTS